MDMSANDSDSEYCDEGYIGDRLAEVSGRDELEPALLDVLEYGAEQGMSLGQVLRPVYNAWPDLRNILGILNFPDYIRSKLPEVYMDQKNMLSLQEVDGHVAVPSPIFASPIGYISGSSNLETWSVYLIDSDEGVAYFTPMLTNEIGDFIAIDAIGNWESDVSPLDPAKFPLSLVQVGSQSLRSVFLFDMLCKGVQSIITLLQGILAKKDTSFLLHDLRIRMFALYYGLQLKSVPPGLIDTQICMSSLGKNNRSISIDAALKQYRIPLNPHRVEFNAIFSGPLAAKKEMIEGRPVNAKFALYAASEVSVLYGLYTQILETQSAIYQRRMEKQSTSSALDFIRSGVGATGVLYRFHFTEENVLVSEPVPGRDPEELVDPPFLPPLEDTSSEIFNLLPRYYRTYLVNMLKRQRIDASMVSELVMDRGMAPSIRIYGMRDIYADQYKRKSDDLVDKVCESLDKLTNGKEFRSDGRMTLPSSLHRISRIPGPVDEPIAGLTMRIGRHWPGSARLFLDVIEKICTERKSLLLVGAPGVGKTTLLRDIIAMISGEPFERRTMVVDTSGEIAGDGASPHECLGRARRMPVPCRENQHKVLIETVQNHGPEVIVVDEISNKEEVMAARTISQRGVSLIATAHGHKVRDVLKNPTLLPLLGGTRSVILGDVEARALSKDESGSFRKTKTERAAPPVFDIAIEIVSFHHFRVWLDLGKGIDAVLDRSPYHIENRSHAILPGEEESAFFRTLQSIHDTTYAHT